MNFQVAMRAGLAQQWRGARGEDFMFSRLLTLPKASVSLMLAVLALRTVPAVCRQTGVQLPLRTQVSALDGSEMSGLLKRAEDSDRLEQLDMASRYWLGVDVPQDYKKAAMWFERAAGQGLAEAKFMMGFLYEHGKGVQRDYSRALEYYRAAADQGHATAANNLASLYFHGLGTPKKIGAALKWYQFSAEHGDASGQCNLGTLYFDGDGVPKDYHEAAQWFRVAAEQGFPPAENKLAFLYFTGQGVVQNYGEAFRWMSRAAEQGYSPAQINLGDLYVEGKGVSLDYVTAYMWYTVGSGGDPRASNRIKNLSRLITSKQRLEAQNRAQSWLSFHPNLRTSQASRPVERDQEQQK
jgi:uncharacterized protein